MAYLQKRPDIGEEHDKVQRSEHWRFLIPLLLQHILLGGTRMMFPVLYLEFAHYFGIGLGPAGWIGSIQSGGTHLFAVLLSGPVNTYGSRPVAIAGNVIIGLSLAASYLAPNVVVLYLTFGLMTGLGMAMVHISTAVLVQQRFHKNRTLATAISTMGNGVGNSLAPLLINALLQTYGWRGTFLVQAGIALNGCVVAMFMWTPKVFRYRPKPSEESGCLKTYIRDVTNFSSLREPVFLLFCISLVMTKFSMFGSLKHLASRAQVDGFSMTQGALLLTINYIGLFLTRVPFGLLADRTWINRTLLLALVLMVSGVILGCMALPDQYIGYAVLSAAFGVTLGCTNVVEHVIQVDILGVEKIARTKALCSAFQGVAVLIGIPFAGWLYDITANYDLSFIMNGAIRVFSGIITLLMFLIVKFKQRPQSFEHCLEVEIDTCWEEQEANSATDSTCGEKHTNVAKVQTPN